MILMMTLDVSADWEGWGSLSRGHHSFQQTFPPYWEGGNTMRSRKTHSMHFSNKNPGHTPCHRLAPPRPTVLRRRQRPRHLKIEPNLFIFAWLPCWFWLDLRALFILITIYPWCFPSFLRSGKTPTKIISSWGTPTKGFRALLLIRLVRRWVIGRRNFGPSLFSNWEFLSGSNRQRLHHHCVTTEPSTLMDAVILTISKNYLMMWHVWIKLDGMTFTRQVRRWYQVDDMVWAIKPTHSPLTFTPMMPGSWRAILR